MPPKSKSNGRKRNWLELPSDIMLNILQRIDVFDILENAQFVCTAWYEICKDPAMWRVVYMDRFPGRHPTVCREMCKNALDRSQGQLVDLTVIDFCDSELLQYVADRSSQLRRLEIIWWFGKLCGHWSEVLKKLSLLEELGLFRTNISPEDIEAVGKYCPLLKKLIVNHNATGFSAHDADNKVALAIGKNLPGLTHLELIGNSLTNSGLQAILDGCCHLESLDLRVCNSLDLKADLGKRCSQWIKHLKLPYHSR